MLKNLELLNEVKVGIDAPISRIVQQFAELALKELSQPTTEKKQLKLPDALLLIKDFSTIVDNLREAIFTTIEYDRYRRLDDTKRTTIKTLLATGLLDALKRDKTKFQYFISTNKNMFINIEFPIEFFNVDNIKKQLQVQFAQASNYLLPTDEKNASGFISKAKNEVKSILNINNSPEAIASTGQGEDLMIPKDKLTSLIEKFNNLNNAAVKSKFFDRIHQELQDKFKAFHGELDQLDKLYPQKALFRGITHVSNFFNNQAKPIGFSSIALESDFKILLNSANKFTDNPSLKQLRQVKNKADEINNTYFSQQNGKSNSI